MPVAHRMQLRKLLAECCTEAAEPMQQHPPSCLWVSVGCRNTGWQHGSMGRELSPCEDGCRWALVSLQVLILLYFADWMVHWMWGRGLDPDNFSIPYLTALGDLLGTGLLALSFHVLWLIGDRDTDVGD